MRKQKQLVPHDPDAGLYGDCLRASIACLLDLPVSDVPHYHDHNITEGSSQHYEIGRWLSTQNKTLIQTTFRCGLKHLLDHMKEINPGVYYILKGRSKTNTLHCVICLNDQVVWDTALDDCGVVGRWPEDNLYSVLFIGVQAGGLAKDRE